MDLSPKLRQTVKTHFSSNGELSHGNVTTGSSRKSLSRRRSGGWNWGSRWPRWRAACEVNPNVLHRWRRELRDYGRRLSRATGNSAGRRRPGRRTGAEGGPAGAGDRFFAALLAACRGAAEAAGIDSRSLVYPYLEKEMSLATPIPLERLCQLALVSRAGFYRWKRRAAGDRRGPGSARRDPADRAGVSLLWLAAHHAGTGTTRLAGQPQAGVPDHARGQSALPAAAEVRGDHQLQPRPAGIPEPGAAAWS